MRKRVLGLNEIHHMDEEVLEYMDKNKKTGRFGSFKRKENSKFKDTEVTTAASSTKQT